MRPVVLTLALLVSTLACAKKKEPETWNISTSYPFERVWKAELRSGTWMNVDVHPDGQSLVFDLLGDLYSLPLSGGEAKRLTGGPAWDQDGRFSPDGKRLLFASDRDGNLDLHVLDLATGQSKRLSEGKPERFVEGDWSPDGRYVIARRRVIDTRSIGMCELWLFDVGGGTGVQLTSTDELPFPNEPTFSPDGRSIYFSSTPWRFEYNRDPSDGIYDLHRLDLETGEVTRLTAEAGSAMRPAINPATGQIALLRRDAGADVLDLFDPATGARVRLGERTFEHDNQEGFAINGLYPHSSWTPDGRELVIWDDGTLVRVDGKTGVGTPIPWSAKAEISVAQPVRSARPAAAGEEVAAKAVRWPRLSPDGSVAVFEAFGRIWSQPAAGGPATPLSAGDVHAFAPSFSADGRRLVYATWHDARQGEVRVRELATGAEQVLTRLPAQYLAPSFSPDGQKVAWLRGSGATLRGHDSVDELWFRLEVWDGQKIQDAGSYWGPGEARAPGIGWTPDSQRLLLTRDEPDAAPHTAAKVLLVSVDLRGKDARTLARWERALEVAVSPDGDEVAWVEGHRVWRAPLPLTAGKTVDLGPETGALPVSPVSDTAGGWLAWSAETPTWSLGPTLHAGERAIALDARLPRARGQGLVAYTNARVITMGAAGVLDGATLVVDGERIVSVGKAPPPAGAKVVDLGGKTVIPGIIDVHAHLHYGSSDAQPQRSWRHEINLAYGVTTVHDPSAADDIVFPTGERIAAGLEKGPRVYSTGYILYGAKSRDRTQIGSLDEARMHLRRQKAIGAISVKSYQQPSREARQWILAAAREEGMHVYPEGGGDLFNNLTMILDGHTGIEHSLPIAPLYDDVVGLYAFSGVGYTPTLLVAYGGISGENLFYQTERILDDAKFLRMTPKEWVDRAVRRRELYVADDDWYHREVANAAAKLAKAGVRVNLGAHGQVQGLGAHWELWALGEAMGAEEALRAATLNGAYYLGMEKDLGSIEAGKLADFVVIDGDVLQDLHLSTRITAVVKGGVRYDGETLAVLAP